MERKIVDYRIVTQLFADDVDDEVHELMKDGWQPQGGVAVMVTLKGNTRFYQAMVKYEDNKPLTGDEYTRAWNEEAKHHLNVPQLPPPEPSIEYPYRRGRS